MVGKGSALKTPLIRSVDRPRKDWLRLYLITDRKLLPENRQLECLEAALKGGARDLQLREKDLRPNQLFPLAAAMRKLTRQYGARLYINDRLDIALMVDADGVHLPEEGLPADAVKARYPHLLVGVSTHSPDSAKKAEAQGADFITFSPIYETASKKKYGPPQGLEKLREVTREIGIPVLALGGITKDRVKPVLEHGAFGVALISGIWNRKNIKQETFEYMKSIGGSNRHVQ